MKRVVTQEGDTVDMVCLRHYGLTAYVTEAVIAANPGLAARGVTLPAGVIVVLPTVRVAPAVANRLYS